MCTSSRQARLDSHFGMWCHKIENPPVFLPSRSSAEDSPASNTRYRFAFRSLTRNYGTFPVRFGLLRLQTTRAGHVALQRHSPSYLRPDTCLNSSQNRTVAQTPVSTKLKHQRESSIVTCRCTLGLAEVVVLRDLPEPFVGVVHHVGTRAAHLPPTIVSTYLRLSFSRETSVAVSSPPLESLRFGHDR